MLRNKLLGWAALVLVIYYIVKDPTGAAGTGKDIGAAAGTTGESIIAFLNALLG